MAVGTTVFLAGAEVETLTRALLDNGVRNILYSYFYILQMRRENFIRKMMDEYPDVNWFLDSGAYTYGVKHKLEPSKLPPLRTYINRYFSYIDDCGERFCRVTETDMDLAGIAIEQVAAWREEMLSRWPHMNVTPVWHQGRGLGEWYDYLRDPRIKTIAVGSGDMGDPGRLRRMVMDASHSGKPVHGFGCTRINTLLKQVPFDSVDSSTWLTGQQYGTTYMFRGNKFFMLPVQYKERRKLYKTYFTNIGCDAKLVIADDTAEVRKANIIAWRCVSDRLETIKRRGRQTHGVENNVFSVPNGTSVSGGGREQPPTVHGVRDAPSGTGGRPRETAAVALPKERGRQPSPAAPSNREPRWQPADRSRQRRRVVPEDAGLQPTGSAGQVPPSTDGSGRISTLFRKGSVDGGVRSRVDGARRRGEQEGEPVDPFGEDA